MRDGGKMEACLAGQEERAAGGGSSQPTGNSAWVGGLVSGGWSALEIFLAELGTMLQNCLQPQQRCASHPEI